MNYSPQIALLEAITCGLILIFYFWHSWHYDRLQAMFRRKRVKNTTGPSNLDSKNSFHLLMRFIYLICLPIYITQGTMVAYIKYQVGYLPVELGGYPVPYTSWPESHTKLIYVIYYLKALGWSGEGIVHLEELAFWIFLIRLKEQSPPWFKSRFFQAFVLLSLLSSAALLCIVSAFKPNVLFTHAIMMTFATGYNFAITCAFFWVLVKFPGWLRDLKNRGAPDELILRLHGFGTLNQIRMVFRLIFSAPLLVLSVDGLMAEPFLNKYVWVVDLIAMASALGFAAQAVITLLIFLPRDLRSECGFNREETKSRFETPHQPLLSQSLEGLCLNSTKPFCNSTLPRDTSGTDSTLASLNEKRKHLNTIHSSQLTKGSYSHPFSFSENDTSGRIMSSQLDNVSQFANSQNQLSFTHGREFDKPIFHPCDTVQCLSPRASHGTTEMTEFKFGKFLETGSSCENFPQLPKESTSLSQLQGPPVSFPISSPVTHFPRYFAPSERRAHVGDSLCTLSRPASPQQNSFITKKNTPLECELLCSIHPAIRNFKSPIDIRDTSFLDIPK